MCCHGAELIIKVCVGPWKRQGTEGVIPWHPLLLFSFSPLQEGRAVRKGLVPQLGPSPREDPCWPCLQMLRGIRSKCRTDFLVISVVKYQEKGFA